MKMLITGGAGYIGWSLVHQFAQNPGNVDEIVIYDNLARQNYAIFSSQQLTGIKVRFVKGEILDGRKLEKELKGVDVVFHLAAKVHTPYWDRDAHFFDQINHWGTAQVVSAVENSGVKHFVYLSSMSVYGSTDLPVDENYSPHPTSVYGISKLDGEAHVNRLAEKMKVHIIRSGNVYGYNPALRIDAVINRFMFNAQFTGRLTIHGDGKQSRAFIHVEKIASVLRRLLNSEVPAGAWNAVEHNFTVNELVEQIQEIYPEVEMLYINQNLKMREIEVKVPCKLFEWLPLERKGFAEELLEYKKQFAF